MTWREQLRGEMRRFEMNQSELARRVGVTATHMSDVLRGRRRLSAMVAVRLSLRGYSGIEMFQAQANDDLEAARAELVSEASK